ncbi:hypothetical protein G5V59_02515 [Nocardioides sp. W3-2-3]|uniref:DUF6093 family protein n=1 Tax=Nocardioides convexus TaxID=2712224 RepID=UPI0024185AE8|nr:DUF6093 family protein [Nocardioides convexus]NGZ99626.1 hypothetical protein [Nocardioides convexus]
MLDSTHDSIITIAPPGGAPTWSEADGHMVTPTADPVYDGPATIRPGSETDGATERQAGEEQVSVAVYEVALPHATVGIAAGQVVTVTDSPDDRLVGSTLTVLHVEGGDRHATRLVRATLNG